MSANNQLTPLSEVLNDEPQTQNQNQNQMSQNQNPTGQFAQMPSNKYIDTRPVTNQVPMGVSQGLSMPEGSSRKEFFGLVKDFDYKTTILVFALILVLSSGLFSTCVRPYVPSSVGTDGKTTVIGSVLAAILGVLLFVIIKIGGGF